MEDTGIFSLPYELQVQVLWNLGLKDLLSASGTCRRLHGAAQAPVLWLRLLDERGLKLDPVLRRRLVAVRSPPGRFDGRDWCRGSVEEPWSLWSLPGMARRYVEGLLWKEEIAIVEEEEVGEDKIPVHFPTLYRSRCYIEDEMRMLGPHRAFDPANPGDDDDNASIASTTQEELYPNHLWLLPHAAKVYTTCIKGSWMLSGSRDRTFKIWRMPALPLDGSLVVYGPQEVFSQHAHDGSVLCLDFEDHGSTGTVITGSSDGTAKVWEVVWGQGDDESWSGTSVTLTATISRHTRAVAGVGLTDEYIVTSSHDGHVLVHDRSPTPQLIHDIHVDLSGTVGGAPAGLALTPRGEVLIAGFECAVPVVNLSTGKFRLIINDLESVTSVDAAGRWFGFGGSANLYSRVEDVGDALVDENGRDLGVHVVWAGGRDATVIRALRVVPELGITYLASHAGHVQLVDWEDTPEKAYRFTNDPPIFSLDRAGMYMVLAMNDRVGVITYGVGKPYAALFA